MCSVYTIDDDDGHDDEWIDEERVVEPYVYKSVGTYAAIFRG